MPEKPGKNAAAKRKATMKVKGKSRVVKGRKGKAFIGTGKKIVNKQGVTALDRSFKDYEAWLKRREKIPPPPGGWPTPPKHWPPGVRVDIGRPVFWLPKGWGQGVKTTCISKLTAYVSPEGKVYYHKHVVEQVIGRKLGDEVVDPERNLEWAKNWGRMVVAEEKDFHRKSMQFKADKRLFRTLSKAERAQMPRSAKSLYFAVISARRADCQSGIRKLVSVQAQLVGAGANPVWYVDRESIASYRRLGLNAKVGGKLVPARNMALRDAAKLGKPCVQISDDISRWDFFRGELGRQVDLAAGNEAARNADRFRVSPVAAAQYLLARMRAARGRSRGGPRLAGVFPLGNTGQAFTRDAVSTDLFILGDFFVADNSPCRFDPRMTLKEDYDYTCTHLAKYGSVFRCNRMFVTAMHETNEGGAVSERDATGKRERENIQILKQKWPGAFWINGKRGDTQVVLSWKRRRLA